MTADRPPAFTCPDCGQASWHPGDKAAGWCARCKAYTACPIFGLPHAWGRWSAPGRSLYLFRVCSKCHTPERRAVRAVVC